MESAFDRRIENIEDGADKRDVDTFGKLLRQRFKDSQGPKFSKFICIIIAGIFIKFGGGSPAGLYDYVVRSLDENVFGKDIDIATWGGEGDTGEGGDGDGAIGRGDGDVAGGGVARDRPEAELVAEGKFAGHFFVIVGFDSAVHFVHSRRGDEAGDEVEDREHGIDGRGNEGRSGLESDVLTRCVAEIAGVGRGLSVTSIEESAYDEGTFDVAADVIDHNLVADFGFEEAGASVGSKRERDAKPRGGEVIFWLPGVTYSDTAEVVGAELAIVVVGDESRLWFDDRRDGAGVEWRESKAGGVERDGVERECRASIVLRTAHGDDDIVLRAERRDGDDIADSERIIIAKRKRREEDADAAAFGLVGIASDGVVEGGEEVGVGVGEFGKEGRERVFGVGVFSSGVFFLFVYIIIEGNVLGLGIEFFVVGHPFIVGIGSSLGVGLGEGHSEREEEVDVREYFERLLIVDEFGEDCFGASVGDSRAGGSSRGKIIDKFVELVVGEIDDERESIFGDGFVGIGGEIGARSICGGLSDIDRAECFFLWHHFITLLDIVIGNDGDRDGTIRSLFVFGYTDMEVTDKRFDGRFDRDIGNPRGFFTFRNIVPEKREGRVKDIVCFEFDGSGIVVGGLGKLDGNNIVGGFRSISHAFLIVVEEGGCDLFGEGAVWARSEGESREILVKDLENVSGAEAEGKLSILEKKHFAAAVGDAGEELVERFLILDEIRLPDLDLRFMSRIEVADKVVDIFVTFFYLVGTERLCGIKRPFEDVVAEFVAEVSFGELVEGKKFVAAIDVERQSGKSFSPEDRIDSTRGGTEEQIVGANDSTTKGQGDNALSEVIGEDLELRFGRDTRGGEVDGESGADKTGMIDLLEERKTRQLDLEGDFTPINIEWDIYHFFESETPRVSIPRKRSGKRQRIGRHRAID